MADVNEEGLEVVPTELFDEDKAPKKRGRPKKSEASSVPADVVVTKKKGKKKPAVDAVDPTTTADKQKRKYTKKAGKTVAEKKPKRKYTKKAVKAENPAPKAGKKSKSGQLVMLSVNVAVFTTRSKEFQERFKNLYDEYDEKTYAINEINIATE